MQAFAENNMRLVNKKAKDEVDRSEDERSTAALSEGTKALHTGKVPLPKNAGAAADAAIAEAEAAEKKRVDKVIEDEKAAEDKEKEKTPEDQGPPKENETNGNEDVI